MSVDGDSGPGDACVDGDVDLDHDRGDDADAPPATEISVPKKRRKLAPRTLPLIGAPTLLCVIATLGSAALYSSLYKDADIDDCLQNGDKLLGIAVVR